MQRTTGNLLQVKEKLVDEMTNNIVSKIGEWSEVRIQSELDGVVGLKRRDLELLKSVRNGTSASVEDLSAQLDSALAKLREARVRCAIL